MELDLGHVAERQSFSFDERFMMEPAPGEETSCSVRVDADVTRTGGRYLLEAGIVSVFTAECGRCLEPFECRTGTRLEIVFQGGGKVQVPDGVEEDDFVFLAPGEEYCYDLFPRVREAVLLDQPIRYLCREDCSGICPGCGENLNESECRCAGGSSDSGWSALGGLLEGRGNEKKDSHGREE